MPKLRYGFCSSVVKLLPRIQEALDSILAVVKSKTSNKMAGEGRQSLSYIISRCLCWIQTPGCVCSERERNVRTYTHVHFYSLRRNISHYQGKEWFRLPFFKSHVEKPSKKCFLMLWDVSVLLFTPLFQASGSRPLYWHAPPRQRLHFFFLIS